MPEQNPSTVLGCWVINHEFSGSVANNKTHVNGSYDVNVWYSYDQDHKTAVTQKTYTYSDELNVNIKNNQTLSNNTEIIVRSLKQPSCTNVNINDDGSIDFEIEKELGIEIVGETKMKINIEDDEEPWQDLNELEDAEDVMKEIDENVNEEYID
jgi:spore coat protein E